MIFRRSKSNGNAQVAGPSVIAQDVVIEGNVSTAGELHIDGTVNGLVRAQACIVDANGIVEGEIVADEVFVRGRVVGPIRGNHVHLYSGAHVEGDVINDSISIENGAYIYGSIRRASEPAAYTAARQPYPREPILGTTPRFDFTQDPAPESDLYRPIKVVKTR
jgi:cytoskeletal protein CcmA (bactofilin family)